MSLSNFAGALATAALTAIIAPCGIAEARLGPGFDCSKAPQPLAQLICASDDLSRIDYYLNQAYNAYRDTLDAAGKKKLAQDEVQFITRVIDVCHIPSDLTPEEIHQGSDGMLEGTRCVAKVYTERTEQLRISAQNAGVAVPNPTPIPEKPAPAAPVAETVQLEREHGVFMVPVRINDAVTIPFVLDSGAGDVSLPEDVFKTLLRTRTVTESDLLSPGTYILGDGSKQSNKRFTLHELRVGNYILRDIVASVAPDRADPLLGQSFLGKLPGWAIDNSKHVLVIGVGGEGERWQTPTAPATPARAPAAKITLGDDVQTVQRSVGALLRKNGGGLAPNRSSCPSQNLFDRVNDGWEFADSTQVVPINATSNAILIDTHMCNGGNGHGQYLVIIQDGSSRVITDAEIADMSFLGKISYVEGTFVFLKGHRWGPNDPHCCPSWEATLQYDIRTGQHQFTLGKRLQ